MSEKTTMYIAGSTVGNDSDFNEAFSIEGSKKNSKVKIQNKIAIVLVITACVLYCFIPAVPFLSVSTAHKAIIVTVLVILGEATFWIAVAIVGKQVVTKYKNYCDYSVSRAEPRPDITERSVGFCPLIYFGLKNSHLKASANIFYQKRVDSIQRCLIIAP
jgi:hypothetical protein